jgi:trimeric autotransporter adhesin
VYVGGFFGHVGGLPRASLAAVDTAGNLTAWNPGTDSGSGVPASVYALAVSGGKVYVGGSFAAAGGQPRKNLAAIDTAGAVTAWSPVPDGPVNGLLVTPGGGTIYAEGDFSMIGGKPRARLAALDAAGNVTPFDPGLTGFVDPLASSSDLQVRGLWFKLTEVLAGLASLLQ